MLPITIIDWHKPKGAEEDEASYVHDHTKNLLYDMLMIHFNLPEGKKEKVKEWTPNQLWPEVKQINKRNFAV